MAQHQHRRLTHTISEVNEPRQAAKRPAEDAPVQEPRLVTLDEPVVTYPRASGAITLFPADLERLREGIYLNDRLIDFMMIWAQDNCLSQVRRSEVQVCDSYMYTQLTRNLGKQDLKEMTPALQANFDRVKGYRRQKGPGAREVCILPVCDDQHWVLAIIFSQRTTTGISQWVMLADSYPNQPRTHITNVLKWYLEDTAVGSAEIQVVSPFTVNQQGNGYDCGLHTIHNAIRLCQYLSNCTLLDQDQLLEAMNANPVPISRQAVRTIIGSVRKGEPVGVSVVPELIVPKEPPAAETNNEDDVGEIFGGQILVVNGDILLDLSSVTGTWVISRTGLMELLAMVVRGRADLAAKGLPRLKFKRTVAGAVVSCRFWTRSGYAHVVVLKVV